MSLSGPLGLSFTEIDLSNLAIGRTVRAPVLGALADNANDVLLTRPSEAWTAYALETGRAVEFPLRWHPATRFARIAVYFRDAANVGGVVTLALTLTDGTSNVAATDVRIPLALQNAPSGRYDCLYDAAKWASGVVAYLDLLAFTSGIPALSGNDWRGTLTATVTGGSAPVIDRLEIRHLPRSYFDDSLAAGGGSVASFQQQLPIVAGDTSVQKDGLQRVLYGLQWAEQRANQVIGLQWPDDAGTSGIPTVTDSSGTPVAILGALSESTGVPVTFVSRVRRLDAASAQGEAHRFRVRYWMSGGTNQSLKFQFLSGSTSSPLTFALPYQSSAAWSAWQTGVYLRTDGNSVPPWGGGALGNQLDWVQFKGSLSAAGVTACYISGIEVRSDPT